MGIGKLHWILPVLWGVLISILSLMPAGQIGMQLFGIPYIDKIGHFGMYGVWAFLIYRSMLSLEGMSGVQTFWFTMAIAASIGIMLEIGQHFFHTGRVFEIWDMIANLAGSLLGTFVAQSFMKKS